MSSSLPRHPSLGHLRKQAKMLLAAQRRGTPASCRLFRRLRRFSAASDDEILHANVSLAEAQLALAIHYGFPNWNEMADEARSHPPSSRFSLRAVMEGAEAPLPDYAAAGVPLAVVAGLNHAGIDIRYMAFAASSGWAFSFGYDYRDEAPSYMAVRGDPQSDGPLEVFAFLPGLFGLEYEMAPTSDPDRLWTFVKERIDAGRPIMSEHLDGGLVTACRRKKGRRQLFFDGTVGPGWLDVDSLQPFAVYSFVRVREPQPESEIIRAALARALSKGREHTWKEVPQGLGALRQYHSDLRDPARDFSECPAWLGWAAFERLMARRCAEVWLRSVAVVQSGHAGRLIAVAADRYGAAYRSYERFRAAIEEHNIQAPEPARTPEQVRAAAPLLEEAIAEEAAGIDALEGAVEHLT